MAVIANRRSVMTLFSKPTCIHSHRTRLVLAEKNINIDIADIDGPDLPEDLMDLNPYHTVPTLVDRDLVLYDSRVIIIETDWYQLAEQFEADGDRKPATKSRKMLRESILASVDLFSAKRYFLSDEFSLVDCSIAPILWRLPVYGIELGAQAEPIEMYMKRVFERRSFQDSLTELEQEITSL